MPFQLRKNGRLAITPDFVPMSLAKVVDLTPSSGMTIDTGIPADRKIISFFRVLVVAAGAPYFTESVSGGTWRITFSTEIFRSAIRLYIFSDYMVNIPKSGFFVYKRGVIVWHSNCLPLRIITSTILTPKYFDYPVASQPGISGFQSAGSHVEHIDMWFAFSAGIDSGTGRYTLRQETYNQYFGGGPPNPGSFTMPAQAYIETAIYDQYYQAALGY